MSGRWMLCRAAEPDHGRTAAVMLVLLFGAMVVVSRLFCMDGDGYTSFWPANAAMVGALLTLRGGRAVLVLIACFCLNLMLNRLSTDESVLASVLNVVQSGLVALLARRFCGALTDLTRLRRLGAFAVIVGLATGLEATIGVGIETRFMHDDAGPVQEWVQWVMCDTLGLLLATPLVLRAVRRLDGRCRIDRTSIEPAILLLLVAGLTVASFLMSGSPLFLLICPAMVILAFRAGPIFVSGSVLVVSIFISAMTAHGLGPIARLSPDGQLMRQDMLQPFLLALFLSASPANNALGETQRASRRIARMKRTLEHAATHDPMTGLMNRQLFRRRLAHRLGMGGGGVVLFVDLDGFKAVNDTYGHRTGDEVLTIFGGRLGERARSLGGAAARFGGDEFALLVPQDRVLLDLRAVCGQVLQDARRPYHVGCETIVMSASIGVAGLSAGDPDLLLGRADLALYAAKDGGRDDYRIFGDVPQGQDVMPAGRMPLRLPAAGATG